MSKSKTAAGRSVEDFRKAHDRNYIIPAKITAGLEQLGDSWCYEGEFLKLSGLSTTDLALFREQFEAHWVVADKSSKKRVWCGTVKLAGELRGMVG